MHAELTVAAEISNKAAFPLEYAATCMTTVPENQPRFFMRKIRQATERCYEY
jgi:hypothetical protein